ncbi:MAG: glutamyl-tRNA(Gln) and/or aspartyl-tRNA(Asn) amidotransferase, A subunit [Parcubacteria group bacterium Athens1014_26]|nr:MAG: glutamyl-tRNA(Gln) and/or aspartyl-tRNA(Asn) amidotransferase, A subunit [Parcubacteria group bacterium Athens1014_26]
MDLKGLTVKKFNKGLVAGNFSACEAVEEFFNSIEEKDKKIDAYLSLNKDFALNQAEDTDRKIAKKEKINLMAGIPMAVKDNILIEGLPATSASKILENYRASYDATVIKKLKNAGAVFLGKTNMDEFAMGSSTENSGFKITKNPHDLTRVPGGSSGGSAAAVAADLAVVALGSDTGGSIRQPAAFCGVVGLKPTYGAVSRYGAMAMASSLDQIGSFGKTVEDAAILFKEISGHDDLDSTSAAASYGEELINPDFENIKKLKIGIPEEYFAPTFQSESRPDGVGIDGLDNEVGKNIEAVINDFKKSGFEIKKISLPHTKYALSCYYIIMPAEASTNLSRYDGIRYGIRSEEKTLLDMYKKSRSKGFGEEVKRRIILGTFVLSAGYYDAYYAKAQKVRSLIKNDFDEAFKQVDVILTPVSPTLPFKIGEKISDPLSMYLSDIFTIPVNLAGVPAVSIPVKNPTTALPVGFQLIGRHFKEADILGLGQYYEQSII